MSMRPDIIKNISKGRNNKLAGQIGEYLVCAELGRRDLIATPFSGNVPAFDILAADDLCRAVPIQVKASRCSSWPSDARYWMQISFDPATKAQKNLGPIQIQNRDLIYVCVAIAPPGGQEKKDRFFILTKAQLQDVCIKGYSTWMEEHEWKRPRAPMSYDCRFSIPALQEYEDNWPLILDRLATARPNQAIEAT
jgi:hypothetical protein